MGILAINVRSARLRIGITQEQLGMLLRVGKTTVNNIETGYIEAPPLELLEKLAKIFEVTVDALIGRKPFEVGGARAVYVTESISCEKPFLETAKIIDTVFINTDELHGYSYIGLKVNDNSMCDAKIFFGDTVIVRQNAILRNGDIVAAVYEGQNSIIRKYFSDGKTVLLKPCTHIGNYKEVFLDKEKNRLVVIGKVVKVEREV